MTSEEAQYSSVSYLRSYNKICHHCPSASLELLLILPITLSSLSSILSHSLLFLLVHLFCHSPIPPLSYSLFLTFTTTLHTRTPGDSVDLGAQAVAIVRQDKLLWVATMDKMVSCYTSKSSFSLHCLFSDAMAGTWVDR